MGLRQTFCGIRNQISRYQGILHADVAHGDSITDGDSRNHDRGSSRHGNSHLNGLNDLIQIHMARYNLIIGTDDTDERTLHLFFRHSEGIEQGAVRRLLHALFY